jgi:hypothetical protein
MPAGTPAASGPVQSHWLWVLCLIGLDYFSTLGYQPSIAYEAAGLLAPIATLVVVAVTLFCALPVYAQVAARSPNGQGAIGLLERLVPGWLGKALILVLLGFAATDFIFTRTLSVADAAVHLTHNPSAAWQRTLDFLFDTGNRARPFLEHSLGQALMDFWNRQMVVTLVLLLLGFAFWAYFRRGFTRKVIQLSAVVVGVYLFLSALVIGSGLYYLAVHNEILRAWYDDVANGRWQIHHPSLAAEGWAGIGAVSLLLFPKLALGLSGFEMSMVVMPLVRGSPSDSATQPRGRVRNTQKLLITAAVVMSIYLAGASAVTTLLIPADGLSPDGAAANRALAYLAHGEPLRDGHEARAISPLFGEVFGTVYDASTVVILCLAGASVTIGLRDLVPPYLHRLGMQLHWAYAIGAILYVFNLIKLCVTLVSHADVSAQRGALATSMLVLLTSASVAAAIDRRPGTSRLRLREGSGWFVLAAIVFALATAAVVLTRPGGLQIAFWCILAMLVLSMVSRALRSTELRFGGFEFVDDESRFLWDSMRASEFPILVPHRPGRRELAMKEEHIRRRHRLGPDVPVVFVEVQLGDPSEFYQLPLLEIKEETGRFLVRISRATSVAHAIAAVGLELSKVGKPPEIHFGWSDERPLAANLNFVLFGEGNIPWMVRELIRRAEPEHDRQPRIVVG